MSAPGEAARAAALDLLRQVLHQHRPLDDALVAALAPGGRLAPASPRDRAFARALVATCLRRLGQLDDALARCLNRPLPPAAIWTQDVLRLAAAQLLFLGTEPYAAVDAAVRQAAARPEHRGLVNAVLRRLSAEAPAILRQQDAARLDCPDWLWRDWCANYGEATARAVVEACLGEPPLDLSVKADASYWAVRLGAVLLPNGSLRLTAAGAIERLPGYATGAWWAQDAAASLPARLLGCAAGDRVLELCAAPGGKTAQLCALGAEVTAVDRSRARIARLQGNLARLSLSATLVTSDVERWRPDERFPFVLLDAPCSATGTLRRHPDVWHLKTPAEIARLAALQDRLLAAASAMLAAGGVLVYCVCSLQREEGEARIEQLLATDAAIERAPVRADELPGLPQAICASGDVRTLPAHWPELGGLDGFFIARLRRKPPSADVIPRNHKPIIHN
ncbi:MAG: MFS transporter [Alphaproteobacteria bacterium]|nr:MFS transporter [Alphaproteobacteria bacterium]